MTGENGNEKDTVQQDPAAATRMMGQKKKSIFTEIIRPIYLNPDGWINGFKKNLHSDTKIYVKMY